MNIQQLRYFREVVRSGLSVSGAATRLHASQPGVSHQLRALEEELGVRLFERHGKRLSALTPEGRAVLTHAESVLQEIDDIRRVADEHREADRGQLAIATTHTQARYVLPAVVTRFIDAHPKVRLHLHQSNPHQIAHMVAQGEADLGIATEALEGYEALVTLPCYEWNRSVVAPVGHPILRDAQLTLAVLARYPIITYDFAFTGRSTISQAFDAQGLVPNVVLTALDADVIKTYVELGLGVGLVASMAYDPVRDTALGIRDAAHLFPASTTRIAVRRGGYVRSYVYAFIALFAPHLQREVVEAAMGAG